MIENRVIHLVFWILNECIHIETRKVISSEYFIGSIRFLCNEGGWHYLLLWICYGRDNLIVHYIAY